MNGEGATVDLPVDQPNLSYLNPLRPEARDSHTSSSEESHHFQQERAFTQLCLTESRSLRYIDKRIEREYLLHSYAHSIHFFTCYLNVFAIPGLLLFAVSFKQISLLAVASIVILLLAIIVSIADLFLTWKGKSLHDSAAKEQHVKWHDRLVFAFVVPMSLSIGYAFHSLPEHCEDLDSFYFISRGSSDEMELYCNDTLHPAAVFAFLIPLLTQRVPIVRASVLALITFTIAVLGRFSNVPSRFADEMVRNLMLACIAVPTTVLTYFSEQTRRRKFESHKLTNCLREELEYEEQLIVKSMSHVLPPVIHHRMLMITESHSIVDSASCATCAIVSIADLLSYTQKMLPSKAALCCSAVSVICYEQAKATGVAIVKGSGDAVIAVANLLTRDASHAAIVTLFSLRVVATVNTAPVFATMPVPLSIGIHSGTLMGACVGERYRRYDLYGSAFNVAVAVQALCGANTVFCTQETIQEFHASEKHQFDTKENCQLHAVECPVTGNSYRIFEVVAEISGDVDQSIYDSAQTPATEMTPTDSQPSLPICDHQVLHAVFPALPGVSDQHNAAMESARSAGDSDVLKLEKIACGVFTRFTHAHVEKDYMEHQRASVRTMRHVLISGTALVATVAMGFTILNDTIGGSFTLKKMFGVSLLGVVPLSTIAIRVAMYCGGAHQSTALLVLTVFEMLVLPLALALTQPGLLANKIFYVMPVMLQLVTSGSECVRVETCFAIITAANFLIVQVVSRKVLTVTMLLWWFTITCVLIIFAILSDRRARSSFVCVWRLKQLKTSVQYLREIHGAIIRRVLPTPIQQRAIRSRGCGTVETWATSDTAILNLTFDHLREVASSVDVLSAADSSSSIVQAVQKVYFQFESFVMERTPLTIVEIFGDSSILAGPIADEVCVNECMIAVSTTLQHLVASGIPFTGVALIEEVVGVLVNADVPQFLCFGTAMHQARALSRAAPKGIVVATEKFVRRSQHISGINFQGGESWRIRGVGILRVHIFVKEAAR